MKAGNRLTAIGGAVAVVSIAAGLVLWKNGGRYSHGLLDELAFAAFLVFLVWILLPRRSNKSPGSDGLSE